MAQLLFKSKEEFKMVFGQWKTLRNEGVQSIENIFLFIEIYVFTQPLHNEQDVTERQFLSGV